MVRRIALVFVNVLIAIGLAASIMPAAILVAPVLRSEPHVGHAIFITVTMMLVVMNFMLWRVWRQR
jgi:hypothetical protein